MKNLELNQMEVIEGGLSDCTSAYISLGFVVAAGVVLAIGTAGLGGVLLWGASGLWTAISNQGACA